METKQLALKQEQQLAPGEMPQSVTPGQMMALALNSPNALQNAEAMEKIATLYREEQDRIEKRSFTADMVRLKQRLQSDPVRATKTVPNNDGTARYTFAPLEEIDKKLAPLALEFGFTYSFAEGASEPGKVTKICVVEHTSGHSRSNPYTVRVATVPKATDTQNDGAAHSYAKRGALLDAFGIIAEKDTDGAGDNPRDEGHPITSEQAGDMERRCVATKTNRKAFLTFAGVKEGGSFSDIMSSRFADCDQELRRREQKAAAASDKDSPEDIKF